MAVQSSFLPRILKKEERYIYNVCAKYLARAVQDSRHNFGQYPSMDFRASICEPWRFPVIDSYYDKSDPVGSSQLNQVTFIYYQGPDHVPNDVAVVGTFANLYQAIPLEKVGDSDYFALTVLLPKRQVFRYKFRVDGQWMPDPINPQEVILPNGEVWSRFFTHSCSMPITFDTWEWKILERLVTHILPLHTQDGQNFLNRYIDFLDEQSRNNDYRLSYLMDESVGVVNFIDKLLAKEENHHLNDYRICLEIMAHILTKRISVMDIELMPKSAFVQLYEEMSTGTVADWDYARYHDPGYFLQLLRRHAYTGAFSHPKYHGNAGGAGWAYLSQNFTDASGKSLFSWQPCLEAPLGLSVEYFG